MGTVIILTIWKELLNQVYKILLTGSSGFIGSNILSSFSEKYKFYIVVRKKIPKKKLIKKNIK